MQTNNPGFLDRTMMGPGTSDRFRGKVEGGELILPSGTIGGSEDPNGPVQLRIAGKGAHKFGISPNTWLVIWDGKVYVRNPGGGQRGQCRRTTTEWRTWVTPATAEQTTAVLASVA